MSLVARVLPIAEWDRLPEYMNPVLMNAKPGASAMCVVEDKGEIVARWLLYPVLYAEDAWIAPAYRQRVSVTRRLWRLVHKAAAGLGYAHMVSTAMTDDAQQILAHVRGVEVMPGPVMAFPVQEGGR